MKFDKFAKIVADRAKSLKLPEEVEDNRGLFQKIVDFFKGGANIGSILRNAYEKSGAEDDKKVFDKLLESDKYIGDDEIQYILMKILLNEIEANQETPEAEETPAEEEEEEEELSLEEKVKFLDDMRKEIVLRPKDKEKNYKIIDFEVDQFMEDPSIHITYNVPSKDQVQMLTASENSIDVLYNVIKGEEDTGRSDALIDIYDKDDNPLPFSFKLIKPMGPFTERIEKLIKPLIKEMLTKGK